MEQKFEINRVCSLGDLLERLCYKTEFEDEGWKKILPLTEYIKEFTKNSLESLSLKMTELYPIAEPNQTATKNENVKKILSGKTIKDSEIYDHFKVKQRSQKLAIYVNQIIPINQEYLNQVEGPIGSHCVVATGIKIKNDVECLVLENHGGDNELKYIPVDFPFFEEVENKIDDLKIKYESNPDNIKKYLNKHGLELAQIKWPILKKQKKTTNWYKNENDEQKYQMVFVKGFSPIYKLEFEQI